MRSSLFETLSLKEIGRLFTIVASTASIAWAGQVAHSSETVKADAVVRATERVLFEEPRQDQNKRTPVKNGLAAFADREIKRNGELFEALIERAELLPVDDSDQGPSDDSIRASLDELDESLLLAKHALTKVKSSARDRKTFNEENLKSQLFRLQDSALKAQGLFIARENSQSFKVSRTGQ